MASFADGENHFVGMDDCVHFVYKIGVWGWVANEDTGIDKFDDGAIIVLLLCDIRAMLPNCRNTIMSFDAARTVAPS